MRCATACRHRRTWISSLLASLVGSLLGLLGLVTPVVAEPLATTSAPSVQFEQQIRPLLEAHCVRCHNAETASGGLRLDRLEMARQGGYSQRPILGGPLESNELYQRISSHDPTYRMPKGAAALTPAEQTLVRDWILQGSPWPAEPDITATNPAPLASPLLQWFLDLPGGSWWLAGLLIVQCGVLLIVRYQRAQQHRVRQSGHGTQQRPGRWLAPLSKLGGAHYLVVCLSMLLVLCGLIIVDLADRLKVREQELQAARTLARPAPAATTFTVYGNPPRPHRPVGPTQLSRFYYRGNCERSPELFNGGNYRTATVRLSLIDAAGRTLRAGDSVGSGQLRIRIELERAPGTTDALFGQTMTDGVLLSTEIFTPRLKRTTAHLERPRVVTPGWKWELTYPVSIAADQDEAHSEGLVYLYQGIVQQNQARGTLHYGIVYDLRTARGILQEGSDLWMGNLFWSSVLAIVPPGKVPLHEWFGPDPIPEITGPNSTDPRLLGIPEHQSLPAIPGGPRP